MIQPSSAQVQKQSGHETKRSETIIFSAVGTNWDVTKRTLKLAQNVKYKHELVISCNAQRRKQRPISKQSPKQSLLSLLSLSLLLLQDASCSPCPSISKFKIRFENMKEKKIVFPPFQFIYFKKSIFKRVKRDTDTKFIFLKISHLIL